MAAWRISQRHRKGCDGGRYTCSDRAGGSTPARAARSTGPPPPGAEAKQWRRDALTALDQGRLRAPSSVTLTDAAGLARRCPGRPGHDPFGDPYKPAAIRGYERALRLGCCPTSAPADWPTSAASTCRTSSTGWWPGAQPVDGADVDRAAEGDLPPRGVARAAATSTRRRARAARGPRRPRPDRRPGRGGARCSRALPDARPGAVGDGDVRRPAPRRAAGAAVRATSTSTAGVIHVERGWDDNEGEIETKGRNRRAGADPRRSSASHLAAHLLRTGPPRRRPGVRRRTATPVRRRQAVRAPRDAAWKARGSTRITLHECRHTFASLMIAAGVNAKALSTYMGHANIAITLDRYGHLMPGNEDEAAGLLDTYLEGAVSTMSTENSPTSRRGRRATRASERRGHRVRRRRHPRLPTHRRQGVGPVPLGPTTQRYLAGEWPGESGLRLELLPPDPK